MKSVKRAPNSYGRQLTDGEILSGAHRRFIGGLWEELGRLQLDFMKIQGLLPAHRLLDVGCGALRGGLKLIDYLEPGHYCGLDINESLIKAARVELNQAGLADKQPTQLVDGEFAFWRFGLRFDFAIAQSVFTHLPGDAITACLKSIRDALTPGGRFFATFFQAPSPACPGPLSHQPGGTRTFRIAIPIITRSRKSSCSPGTPASPCNSWESGATRAARRCWRSAVVISSGSFGGLY